ncbi:MAG: NUDIX hydrolase [Saprospiraceae bacterium]|nr:NUDIX hydrolase [Pyrinomonadaceae bacterium]
MKEDPKRNRIPTLEQVSAGGVAFRKADGRIEVAIILTVPEMRWQLPKGMIDEGETAEQAATREVREEAGIATDIVASIEKTEYWFFAERDGERTRFHKFVHWFLMRYSSGDVEDHDDEVAEARWVAVDEALTMLVFKNEREIVEKARNMIRIL